MQRRLRATSLDILRREAIESRKIVGVINASLSAELRPMLASRLASLPNSTSDRAFVPARTFCESDVATAEEESAYCGFMKKLRCLSLMGNPRRSIT